MSRHERVELSCKLVTETAMAYLVQVDGDGEKVWLPKSQVEDEEFQDGSLVSLSIPQWLAEEKELV